MLRCYSKQIEVGKVKIGGGAPIVVQGMTKTDSEDLKSTFAQVKKLSQAGAEIIRLALPTIKSTRIIPIIKENIETALVADIHFDYRIALEAINQGIDKVRINPGNLKKEDIRQIVNRAREKKIPLRIGVNSGSLKKELQKRVRNSSGDETKILAEAMVQSAWETIEFLERERFFDMVISLKSPDVSTTILANKLMAEKISYPLHLGITAAGPLSYGIIKSSLALGALLSQGIGDTIRVSLTADPVKEVEVAREILQFLHLGDEGPVLLSCPTCGRCKGEVKLMVEKLLPQIKNLGIPLKIAVMGCEVNGPGEAKQADIGIFCTPTGRVLFRAGKFLRRVKKKEMLEALIKEIESYTSRFSQKKNLPKTQDSE